MSGLIDMLGIRKELKGRVDEILKSGNEWQQTAKLLVAVLERHTEALQVHMAGCPEELIGAERNLTAKTKHQVKAFESLNRTMEKIAEKV